MKIGKWILTIWLAASAWAQTSAPKAQAAAQSAAKPSGLKTASLAATPVLPAGKPASPAAPSAKVHPAAQPKQQTPASASPAKHVKRRKTGQQPSAVKTVAEAKPVPKGRRDPFVSPIIEKMSTAASCTGAGKRCLYIGDLSLLGIVQAPNGVIAVVASGPHTYFLREHDPLADGDVERITRDAITMRQRSSDVLGRPLVREVIRKIGAPAV